MKSKAIKRNDGTTVIYHRFPRGNDIVSTAQSHNAYWGSVDTAPEDVDFIIDNGVFYYKTYDRDKNLIWQKMYVGGVA